jgi:acylphosphatase
VTTKRVHVLVSGEVQGVFFRAECASRARAEGLGGFVRNLADGRVEALFEGETEGVERLVDWCRTGPQWANVTSVDVEEHDPVGETEFEIAH